MLTTTLTLLGLVIGLTAIGIAVDALVKWDGKKHCKPDDCDTCPFPPCDDKPKGDQ